MQPDAHTIDVVVGIIAIGALVIGLISMGIGRAADGYDRMREWWQEGVDKARGVNGFDDDIMSREPQNQYGTGSEPPQNHPGSLDTSAERTSTHDAEGPVAVSLHNHLSRAELLTLLAIQKAPDGEYVYSANKIADLVGGARQKTLEQINVARGMRPEEPQRSSNHLSRPENGWG